MPLDAPSTKASKAKRIKNFGRVLSNTDTEFHLPYSRIDDSDIVLPVAYRYFILFFIHNRLAIISYLY